MPCAWIRGEMEQAKRIESIRKFHEGEVPFLIATDVAARGIDLPNVSHVINYDMPYGADVYVHRIGRTGRAGNRGCAISLVEAHDMAMVAKIERYTEERLKRRVIDELRPRHKEARVPVKKKKPKDAKKSAKKKKVMPPSTVETAIPGWPFCYLLPGEWPERGAEKKPTQGRRPTKVLTTEDSQSQTRGSPTWFP